MSNTIAVKPSELLDILVAFILQRMPVLVTGMPGAGKSDIVAAACARAGTRLLLSHPAVEEPTVPGGMPWVEKGKARFVPFGILEQAINAKEPTTWFLDDLGQASPAVQAAYMQLLLAGRVGEHVLPDTVGFVAATNRRTDRAGVSGILEPVKSRFATILELQPDLDDWCAWAYTQPYMTPEPIAFLRWKGVEMLANFQPSADLTNSPVPRTWARVARIMSMGLSDELLFKAVAGAVGQAAAAEYMAFLRMWQELPNIDHILTDPDSASVPDKPSVLYSVAAAVALRATRENFSRIARYAERLYEAGFGENAVHLVRDCIRRNKDVTTTAAYNKLAAGELGRLQTGQLVV